MGSSIPAISDTTSVESDATVRNNTDDEGTPEQEKACHGKPDCFISKTDQQRYQSLVKPDKPSVTQDVKADGSSSQDVVAIPPAIKIADGYIGATAAYKRTIRYDGTKYPNVPAEGEILVGDVFLNLPEKSCKRTLVHELTHHRFDHVTQDQQKVIVETFEKSNSIEDAKKFLFNKDDFGVYKRKYDVILEKYGEEATNKFVVDETIAALVSFRQYPATVAYVNEPKPSELEKLVEEMGSVDAVKKACKDAGAPWHLPENPDDALYIETNRSDIPADEKVFYGLQAYGMKLIPELEKTLIENNMIPTRDETGAYYQNIKTIASKISKKPL